MLAGKRAAVTQHEIGGVDRESSRNFTMPSSVSKSNVNAAVNATLPEVSVERSLVIVFVEKSFRRSRRYSPTCSAAPRYLPSPATCLAVPARKPSRRARLADFPELLFFFLVVEKFHRSARSACLLSCRHQLARLSRRIPPSCRRQTRPAASLFLRAATGCRADAMPVFFM